VISRSPRLEVCTLNMCYLNVKFWLIGFLEQIKKETSETIVKIRSNTDAAENQRRMLEERTKKDR
jgi:hypothetical protein